MLALLHLTFHSSISIKHKSIFATFFFFSLRKHSVWSHMHKTGEARDANLHRSFAWSLTLVNSDANVAWRWSFT